MIPRGWRYWPGEGVPVWLARCQLKPQSYSVQWWSVDNSTIPLLLTIMVTLKELKDMNLVTTRRSVFEGFVSPRRLGASTVCDQATGTTVAGCGVDSPVTELCFTPCPLPRTESLAEVPACRIKEPEVESGSPPIASLDAINQKLEELSVLDEFPQRPAHDLTRDLLVDNPFAVLASLEVDEECTRMAFLRRRGYVLVGWYQELGLEKVADLPSEIRCGGLRAAVRHCFPDVDPVWELSFKTIAKIERSCCKACLPRFEEKLVQWETARSVPVGINESHLDRFRLALRANVDRGWDRFRRPFIPNGNATLEHTRKDGGNWNLEEFSEDFRTELVFSSGKPRVVTLYSSQNTRVLAPLHYSLYSSLKRKGWLLVGEPTDRHVQKLVGSTLLSFDYSSATDNIKTAYVTAAIEVLKEQADHIDEDEAAALDVLGGLAIDGVRCETGQPMGSVMSFPLLCLINKTVVDLAMNRLLIGKEISFKEWSSHRCLINGDDLLTREVRKGTNLRGLIAEEGSEVGLVVNDEKTMSSDHICEINSTLFESGKKVRKFNASSVWMDPGVEDVLGFASQAAPDLRTFRKIVRQNCNILAKSENKHLAELPYALQMVCRRDKKIRRAITSVPASVREKEKGVITMAPVPDGYDLSIEDEHLAMLGELSRVRARGVAWAKARATRKQFRTVAVPNSRTFSQVLKTRTKAEQELIPACYVRAYANKVKDALVEKEVACLSSETLPPGDGSKISIFLDNLRAFKRKRADQDPGPYDPIPSGGFGDDYVSLS